MSSDHVPGSLGPDHRRDALERLARDTFDVLVVGGGVTGVGCALDAASRGLDVALVEQRDLGAGTSSRSSKLIHGGLRYLEQLDVGLVQEALSERGRLAGTICPHLVRPVTFLIPLTQPWWQRAYYGAGVLLYDGLSFLGRTKVLPSHRHVTAGQARSMAPAVRADRLRGGITYHDAQVDDARHTLAVARTAAELGATIATSVKVESLVTSEGVVTGAVLVDVETGTTIEARARHVVSAAGVWTDQIHGMVEHSSLTVRASKGVHLVVDRSRIDSEVGLVARTASSVLFIIPWADHWIIGTTDTDWDLDLSHPAATSADIDYLLAQANEVLTDPLTTTDVVGVYVGLRPLVHGEADSTASLSREHAVLSPMPGLTSIVGGKYTTYRVMARDTIDVVVDSIPGCDAGPSRTADLELIGATGWALHRTRGTEIDRAHDLAAGTGERLLWRHGSRVDDVLRLVETDADLAELLPGGVYLRAEVVHAVRHEGARELDDVLARRTRLSIESSDRGAAAAPIAAALMAAELGWTKARRDQAVQGWLDRLAAERDSHSAPDDVTAQQRRNRAVDSRGLLDV